MDIDHPDGVAEPRERKDGAHKGDNNCTLSDTKQLVCVNEHLDISPATSSCFQFVFDYYLSLSLIKYKFFYSGYKSCRDSVRLLWSHSELDSLSKSNISDF